MKKELIKKNMYVGSELNWGVEDVYMVAKDLGVTISTNDAKRVLIASLEDNYDLMGFINEEIAKTIEYMDEQQLIELNR
jgi:hypothetical protein